MLEVQPVLTALDPVNHKAPSKGRCVRIFFIKKNWQMVGIILSLSPTCSLL